MPETKPIQLNQALPPFTLSATSDKTVTHNDLLGSYTVLYFYPKDNTPGCTTEGQDFTAAYPEFQALNTEIYGISRDSLRKHENFKAKYEFPFELISDPTETLCNLFDVIKQKTNYGKTYLGIERSTFLFNPNGQLIQEWRKVKVIGHVKTVLAAVKAHQSNPTPP